MRITKPRNWQWMTKEEKERWAVQAGKDIEEGHKKFMELIKAQKIKDEELKF
jgi:hypothetical protein